MYKRSWQKLALTVCTSLGILWLSASAAQAGTVDFVQQPVLDPSGNPIEGVPAYLYDSNDVYVNYTTTNSVGYASYGSVVEGDYVIQLRPQQASTCAACSLYNSEDISFTASLASATDSGSGLGFVQTLTTVTLEQASRYITVTVVDQDGTLVEGIYVYAWTADGGYAYGSTDSAGQYSFAVDEADDSTWSVGAYSTDSTFSSAYEYDFPVTSTGQTAIDLAVIRPDAFIAVNLVDSAGAAITLGETAYGSVYCYDMNASAERYFYNSILPGQSSATVGVLSGYTYTCNAWLQDYGSASIEVTPVSGATASADIVMLAHDADVTFRYVDAAGNVITGLTSMYAYASSLTDAAGAEYYGDYAYGSDEDNDGEIDLSVADDITYSLGGWFDQGSTAGIAVAADGTSYIQSYEQLTVTGDNTTTQVIEQTLQEADATIVVTVLTADGDAETSAWVSAVEETNDHTNWGTYLGGMTDHTGEVELAASSGKTYRVYAYPTSAYTEGSGSLAPTSQLVTLAPDETATITMQSVEADWTVAIDASYDDDSSDDNGYTYCYAYNSDLAIDTYVSLVNNSGQMQLVSGNDWSVGCMGYQNDTFYRSNDVTYSAGSVAAVDDTLEVELSAFSDYYSAQTYSFSATAATTLTLPDGVSTLVVPANAIDTTGTVSVTVETATDYSVNDNSYPVFAYQFTALNSSGEVVTEFSSNLTLNLAYDEDKLAELGMSEDDLLGASFDSDTNAWGAPVSTSIDTENNLIQIVLSHFSTYGAIGDRSIAASKPGIPKHLVVNQITKHRAVADWRKGSGSAKTYRLQVRKFGKPKSVVLYRGIHKTRKLLKGLVADTRYQVRVRGCNAQGCSGYTDWKRFTTK
ncbi:MAG: hypothetical protein HY565_02690 [Candidatus Kerfeldbacteria bacterium]|nr:hypothetical protein [Candidatus Kerfeldbacteria bacterium]